MKKKTIREEIMDLRDARIRLQRKVVVLEEKKLYEPEAFDYEDSYNLVTMMADIERIKAREDYLRHTMA